MGSNLTVTLRPPTSGTGKREYVDKHELKVSEEVDADSEKITFAATDHSFVVVIPDADKLFINPAENTLHSRVSPGAPYVTPTINGNVNEGEMYEYHVYCEEEGDWAHKRGASPPKIIITG